MSEFLRIPPLRIGGSGEWILEDDLVYRSDLLTLRILIPKGFETDLASIPRIVQPLIPVNGKHRAAAIVHDFIYSLRGRLPAMRIDRKLADDIFLEAMESLMEKKWRRYVMYAAVRMGGWVYWDKA